MDKLDDDMSNDEAAPPPNDVAPVCKPQAMIGAGEEFLDQLLILEKQLWQLHLLRPNSEAIGKAFLSVSHLEVLAAPVTGRGMASRRDFGGALPAVFASNLVRLVERFFFLARIDEVIRGKESCCGQESANI